MHVALAAVHYHADIVKGISVLIVPDIDVVSGGFDVSVAAKGARENIQYGLHHRYQTLSTPFIIKTIGSSSLYVI